MQTTTWERVLTDFQSSGNVFLALDVVSEEINILTLTCRTNDYDWFNDVDFYWFLYIFGVHNNQISNEM